MIQLEPIRFWKYIGDILKVMSFLSSLPDKLFSRVLIFANFNCKKISRVLIFANLTSINISRVFNFAKMVKIREFHEKMYPQKLVLLRSFRIFSYTEKFISQ